MEMRKHTIELDRRHALAMSILSFAIMSSLNIDAALEQPWIKALCASNLAPSPQEYTEVKHTLLPELYGQATRLENEIARLTAALHDLQTSRDGVLGAIHRLERVRHPIRTLPDDILRVIFEECMPWCQERGIAGAAFPPMFPSTHIEQPWTVSRVCRNWRAVALSHPCLWATWTVRLEGSQSSAAACIHHMALLNKRSGKAPLRIFLRAPDRLPYISQIIDWLAINCIDRWIDARFMIHSSYFSKIFYQRTLPALSELSLFITDSDKMDVVELQTPALRHLEQVCAEDDDVTWINIPWGQLTRYASCDSDLGYLQLMKNVEALEVSDVRARHDLDNQSQTLALPRVTFLSIRDNCEEVEVPLTAAIFDRHTFPAVRTLVLTTVELTDQWADSIPSFPTLLNLSITTLSYDHSPDNIISVIKKMPNVRGLHIDSSECGVEVIDSLALEPQALARLEDLRLTVAGTPGYPDALSALLTGRETAQLPLLRRLAFYYAYEDVDKTHWLNDIATDTFLQRCVERGVEVSFIQNEHWFESVSTTSIRY